jgi:acyl-CoA synthetase (AMP-forming)/AMP-acid ligase II
MGRKSEDMRRDRGRSWNSIRLQARRCAMIISGAENIYSLEVEAVLVRHPSVRQCAVIGIPHPVWGEAVHAIVPSGRASIG